MITKEFVRQPNNNAALVNKDNDALIAYKRQRTLLRNVSTFEERLVKLEETITEIKTLLETVVTNGKKQCQYK
jgi:hypothetical protein